MKVWEQFLVNKPKIESRSTVGKKRELHILNRNREGITGKMQEQRWNFITEAGTKQE